MGQHQIQYQGKSRIITTQGQKAVLALAINRIRLNLEPSFTLT